MAGPGWVRETHGFASVPLLVREDSVLALGAREDRPDYDYRDGVPLRLYEPAEGTRTVRVAGTTFEVTRQGATIRVSRTGEALPWRIALGDAEVSLAARDAVGELRR